MAIAREIFDCAPTATADDATLDIRPASGHEAVIHNIYTGQVVCELYKYDGTNLSKIDENAAGWLGYVFHVTNSIYLQVKNTSGSPTNISFDGIYTNPETE